MEIHMLLKALCYFANNFFKNPNAKGYMFVSGETHWTYRIYVEALFLAGVGLPLLAYSLFQPERTSASTACLYIGVVITGLGALEIVRLFWRRKEEIAFAEMFYG
jgi:uncharacterized membrane protein HdeD (DUF308 family)